jgi:hypothetical protein
LQNNENLTMLRLEAAVATTWDTKTCLLWWYAKCELIMWVIYKTVKIYIFNLFKGLSEDL